MVPSKLTRLNCLLKPEEQVARICHTSPDVFLRFLLIIQGETNMVLLQDDIQAITRDFRENLTDADFIQFLISVKETLNGPPWVFIAVDNSPLGSTYSRVHVNTLQTKEVEESAYVKFKEELFNGSKYGPELVSSSKLSEAITSLLDHAMTPGKKKKFSIVIFSSHGSFLYENVLRYPKAGGQVIHIVKQVCDLENMLQSIMHKRAKVKFKIVIVTPLLPNAVGATKGYRLQKLECAKHVSLLQIPNSLEELTEDTINVIEELLQKKNLDIIIGSDWDGNQRASLLAKHLGARQVHGDLAMEASWREGPRMFLQTQKKIRKD